METVADLGTAAAGLIDAELRSLRRTAARLVAAALIGVAVLLLALVAGGFLLAALFLALKSSMSAAASAASVAGITLVIAATAAVGIWRLLADRAGVERADIMAARSRIKEITTQIGLFPVLRRHPWVSIAIAAAVGAMLAASTESLVGAVALTKAVNALLRTAVSALVQVLGEAPAAPAPASKSA